MGQASIADDTVVGAVRLDVLVEHRCALFAVCHIELQHACAATAIDDICRRRISRCAL